MLIGVSTAVPVAAAPTPVDAPVEAPAEAPAPQTPTSLASLASPTWPTDAVPGRLLVTLEHSLVDLNRVVKQLAGRVTVLGPSIRLVQVASNHTVAATQTLRATPGVQAVEPDRVRAWSAVPNDALYERQWSHTLTRVSNAWDTTVGSRAVRVALLDSGVQGGHPDLAANVIEQWDLSSGTPVLRPRGVDNDTCGIGHGTQVAGVLGGVGNNGIGVSGVAWEVGIVDIALGSQATPGSCEGASDSAILKALDYVTFGPAGAVDVVNLSVGGRQAYCPEAYERAIDEARREGVVVIAAAGNSGAETAQVPASCPGVIAVAGVGPDGQRANYSASNSWVDVAAPGGWDATEVDGLILTTSRRGDWTRVRGTSFAAPYVAGVAALLRAKYPEMSPNEIESVLERSAENAAGERTPELGWGVVRADRALLYAARRTVVPSPEPDPDFPVLRLEPMPDGPGPLRIAAFDSITGEPVATTAVVQAVVLSREVFRPRGAVTAVLAREDDFADAMAGSALGMGIGPLLFNPRGEELHPQVRKEIRRAVPPGTKIYVLGGERGLGRGVTTELRSMGYLVSRLAGPTREDTAAEVAREIARIRQRSGMPPIDEVIVATRTTWADAVGAGPLSARWAIPVLLTEREHLHPATQQLLQELLPQRVIVVGSDGRVSDEVALRAQAAAGGATLLRLAGASRHGTSAEVSREALNRLGSARLVVAVNLERDDGYAHALSASVLAGAYGAVFASVTSPEGRQLSDPASLLLDDVLQKRRQPADLLGVLAGGADVVAESAAEELRTRLERR